MLVVNKHIPSVMCGENSGVVGDGWNYDHCREMREEDGGGWNCTGRADKEG